MATTYQLISSNVLTGSAASVTFSSVPSTYTDLVLRVSARGDTATGEISVAIRPNNDSSSVYSFTRIRGNGSTASSLQRSAFTWTYATSPDTSDTASTFGNNEYYIPSYTASQNKPMSLMGITENNATTGYIDAYASLWSSTSAITSLTVLPTSGNFVSGSSFYLYGISKS